MLLAFNCYVKRSFFSVLLFLFLKVLCQNGEEKLSDLTRGATSFKLLKGPRSTFP